MNGGKKNWRYFFLLLIFAFFPESEEEGESRKPSSLLHKHTYTHTHIYNMLNACCGGARPGHEKGGLHDMNTLELPSGHLKIDPEGALFSSSVLHFFETSSTLFCSPPYTHFLLLLSHRRRKTQTRGRWRRITLHHTCIKCATKRPGTCKRFLSRKTIPCRKRSIETRTIWSSCSTL